MCVASGHCAPIAKGCTNKEAASAVLALIVSTAAAVASSVLTLSTSPAKYAGVLPTPGTNTVEMARVRTLYAKTPLEQLASTRTAPANGNSEESLADEHTLGGMSVWSAKGSWPA